jgi:hypothetical protein
MVSIAANQATQCNSALLMGRSLSNLQHQSDVWDRGDNGEGHEESNTGEPLIHWIDDMFDLLSSR